MERNGSVRLLVFPRLTNVAKERDGRAPHLRSFPFSVPILPIHLPFPFGQSLGE